MLKTRTWIKLGVGLVFLLIIVFIAVLAWPTAPPSPESIAKRGLEAPEKRPSAWNGSFGAAQDWLDQNWDALASWDKNPFGIRNGGFSQHLMDLKRSKDPKDQAEYRRLLELAKKWHENLLSRYPELRVAYRDIPDERNALKQWADLKERLTNEDGSCRLDPPDNLSIVRNWDPKAAQAWLDANRATVDELRRICLMPESSGKDVDLEALGSLISHGHQALLLDARLAADRGDLAASMESVRAIVSLANHFQDSEAPYLFHSMVVGEILGSTRDAVFASILANLPPEQVDLAAWENVLDPTVQTPADFARTMRGEWNSMMSKVTLPALIDPAEGRIPADAELFVETYTKYCMDMVQTNAPLALTDLPAHPNPTLDSSGLSWRSQRLIEVMPRDLRMIWERQQIRTGLTQAAFAILRGQPVPNDPIHGQPYTWNPETRELSLPKGPEFSRMQNRPVKLPKL